MTLEGSPRSLRDSTRFVCAHARAGGLAVLVVAGWGGGIGCGAASGATTRQDEAARFFAAGAIPHLRIQIPSTNLARLQRDARAYVRASVRDGDTVYDEVGVHLKGAAGSFQAVNDAKPALTLNFDKFVEHQNFHGVDKLALNNSVQDPSYMTEAICADLFLAAGVPTPRATHARVELNGRDLGLYVLKEGFDKAFLRRHFKNVKGNLYDGGFLREITEPLDRTSGDRDVPARADLRALAAAAQEPDHSRRLARLEQVLDVDRFLSFSVLEMLTWHWDGYTLKKNNYRVYHDPDANKMIFFPHGMDQMFWSADERIIPRPGQAEGLVARALLETAEGQRRYRERAVKLVDTVFTEERLTNQILQLRARIRPALAAFDPDAARKHDATAMNLLNAVRARARRARQILDEPEPEPLKFTAVGEARLLQWRPLDLRGTGLLDQPAQPGGRTTLHIAASPAGRCTASWRTHLLLPPGHFVFTTQLRTAGVVPLEKDVNTKGLGAGIRQSNPRQTRKHGLLGDHDWQTVEYEFVVPGESEPVEVDLLCELRAEKGEAWFDLGSLVLKRK